ncbi:MAG: c-type cytochrome [Bacteroidales bacterium]|nr:c-type cytochrome [Bacteroidales bacterium]
MKQIFFKQAQAIVLSKLCLMLIILFSFGELFAQSPEAERNYQVCRACHNYDGPKLIGPNLIGVNDRHEQDWLIRFIRNSQEMIQAGDPEAVRLFEENDQLIMTPNEHLSDEQIIDILLYIENGLQVDPELAAAAAAAETDEEVSAVEDQWQLQMAKERDAHRNTGTTFIITLIILLVVLFDMFVTKLIKYKIIHSVLILIGLVVIGEIAYKEAAVFGRQQYYQPEQPIWFSHKVHADQNEIDCQYCHTVADQGKSAGIPSVNVCMNCHHQVKEGQITGKKEIDKIQKAWETGEPIEWIRVYNLPDHVYFNHAQHVEVAKIDCAECHGEVENMHEVIQIEDLSMRWCLDCHRTTEVMFESNAFYTAFEKLHDQVRNGTIKSVTADMVGGADCMKCHY